MTIIFNWEKKELDALLDTCGRDEIWPLVKKYFAPGTAILEAGCGAGRWVRFLADQGWKACGLEYSQQTVEMVRSVWPDLNVIQGDCANSPFPENNFDGVLSLGVVEHWKEGPQKPLRDIYRVLKSGGRAIISVPCLNLIRRIKRGIWWDEILFPQSLALCVLRKKPLLLSRLNPGYLFAVYPAWGEFFEYRMTDREFKEEVARAGFKILAQFPIGSMDGVYHELNPLRLLVRFKDWKFRAAPLARWLERQLSKAGPYFHQHMQVIVAQK